VWGLGFGQEERGALAKLSLRFATAVAAAAAAASRPVSSPSATMVQRLTYRRRHCYATKSNQTRVVKTPG